VNSSLRDWNEKCATKGYLREPKRQTNIHLLLSGLVGLGLGNRTLMELVLEAALNDLKMAHTAGAGSTAAVGLNGPAKLAEAGRWVCARGANLILAMVCTVAAAGAQNVRLGVAQTERLGTLSHLRVEI